ncbi:MAG: filamentous hemagglutinin N-terminal domain-containing protein [Deltaproteobacteria bacterium]|jgi:filamentous hemagglutinin family protein|nr:filamentous hemagglutinin N-terminal domain-containing protein [Deltaproteobacteria bacterium]
MKAIKTFLISLMISLLLCPAYLLAGPEDGGVAAGQASINQAGPVTTIDQTSQRAIINWRSFDIGQNEAVRHNMPSAGSAALHRVIGGGGASQLKGELTSNGNIYLVNPAGVVIHNGARIDTGGFVATTRDISDDNFMGDNLVFDKPGQPGAKIINQGQINVRDSGLAALVAPSVRNDGVIAARLGKVALASGDSTYKLDFHGDDLIAFSVNEDTVDQLYSADGSSLGVENAGTVKAEGGVVLLSASQLDGIVSSVVNSGTVSASSAEAKGGQIIIKGEGDRVGVVNVGELAASSENGDGGSIRMTADGQVTASGTIEAKGAANGGQIDIAGAEETNIVQAKINAEGKDGGLIRLGGEFQGGREDGRQEFKENFVDRFGTSRNLTETKTLVVDSASEINAGLDGTLIAWSGGSTSLSGTLYGRYVETSGPKLALENPPVLSDSGVWVLDPKNIEIIAGGNQSIEYGDEDYFSIDPTWLSSYVNGTNSNFQIKADNSIKISSDLYLKTAYINFSAKNFILADNMEIKLEDINFDINADEITIGQSSKIIIDNLMWDPPLQIFSNSFEMKDNSTFYTYKSTTLFNIKNIIIGNNVDINIVNPTMFSIIGDQSGDFTLGNNSTITGSCINYIPNTYNNVQINSYKNIILDTNSNINTGNLNLILENINNLFFEQNSAINTTKHNYIAAEKIFFSENSQINAYGLDIRANEISAVNGLTGKFINVNEALMLSPQNDGIFEIKINDINDQVPFINAKEVMFLDGKYIFGAYSILTEILNFYTQYTPFEGYKVLGNPNILVNNKINYNGNINKIVKNITIWNNKTNSPWIFPDSGEDDFLSIKISNLQTSGLNSFYFDNNGKIVYDDITDDVNINIEELLAAISSSSANGFYIHSEGDLILESALAIDKVVAGLGFSASGDLLLNAGVGLIQGGNLLLMSAGDITINGGIVLTSGQAVIEADGNVNINNTIYYRSDNSDTGVNISGDELILTENSKIDGSNNKLDIETNKVILEKGSEISVKNLIIKTLDFTSNGSKINSSYYIDVTSDNINILNSNNTPTVLSSYMIDLRSNQDTNIFSSEIIATEDINLTGRKININGSYLRAKGQIKALVTDTMALSGGTKNNPLMEAPTVVFYGNGLASSVIAYPYSVKTSDFVFGKDTTDYINLGGLQNGDTNLPHVFNLNASLFSGSGESYRYKGISSADWFFKFVLASTDGYLFPQKNLPTQGNPYRYNCGGKACTESQYKDWLELQKALNPPIVTTPTPGPVLEVPVVVPPQLEEPGDNGSEGPGESEESDGSEGPGESEESGGSEGPGESKESGGSEGPGESEESESTGGESEGSGATRDFGESPQLPKQPDIKQTEEYKNLEAYLKYQETLQSIIDQINTTSTYISDQQKDSAKIKGALETLDDCRTFFSSVTEIFDKLDMFIDFINSGDYMQAKSIAAMIVYEMNKNESFLKGSDLKILLSDISDIKDDKEIIAYLKEHSIGDASSTFFDTIKDGLAGNIINMIVDAVNFIEDAGAFRFNKSLDNVYVELNGLTFNNSKVINYDNYAMPPLTFNEKLIPSMTLSEVQAIILDLHDKLLDDFNYRDDYLKNPDIFSYCANQILNIWLKSHKSELPSIKKPFLGKRYIDIPNMDLIS